MWTGAGWGQRQNEVVESNTGKGLKTSRRRRGKEKEKGVLKKKAKEWRSGE